MASRRSGNGRAESSAAAQFGAGQRCLALLRVDGGEVEAGARLVGRGLDRGLEQLTGARRLTGSGMHPPERVEQRRIGRPIGLQVLEDLSQPR